MRFISADDTETGSVQAEGTGAHQVGVRVLNKRKACLFEWAGPARSIADAECNALAAFEEAARAVFKTYQLNWDDRDDGLQADHCVSLRLRTPTRWKLSGQVLYAASLHDKAILAGLTKSETQALLNAAVAADPVCFDALLRGSRVEIGLWVHRVAADGMFTIDHAITIAGDASPMKRKVTRAVLRDAIRIVALRALSRFPDATRRRNGRPAFARDVVLANSATLLAAEKKRYGALRPGTLIGWLEQEGQGRIARDLAAAFPREM